MSLHIRVVAALTLIYSQIQSAEAILNNCYDPSGVQDFKLFACQPKAASSSCCKAGDICYSNGLCAPGPTEPTGITPFFLDGCTDTSFAAPNCIPSCLTITGNGVQNCPLLGANHFCCYGFGGCNCSDPNAVFTLQAGTIVTTIDPSATYTASVSSTATSSAATTTTSSGPTGTGSTSPTSTPAPTHGVAIGVGVGIGTVAVAALAGLGYFFWRRRKSHGKATELSAEQAPQPPPFQEYYADQAGKPQGGYPPQAYPAQGYQPTHMNELPSNQYYQPVGELPSHPYN
ncbi:hypothetical protein N431DRAFT_547673 [Stipitochalara longipes BDJ]|nr:hypothetical protein N431DRAFT_547673 [Stipitochalara longipes BDJ]